MKYIILLICLTLLINVTSAERIGVSPATSTYEKVLRGGYAEKIITITTDTQDPTLIEAQARGDIAEWLEFKESDIEVTRDNPYRLVVAVSPPEDIPNGNYTGFLRIKSTAPSTGPEKGGATGFVTPVLDIVLTVEITDIEYYNCRADSFTVNSVEEGENVKFKTRIRNLGNTRINPKVRIDIWDQDQIEIIDTEEFSTDFIAPTTQKEIEVSFNSNKLDLGQYWADALSIDCGTQTTLTFDILEEGALKAIGTLVSIESPPWINVGETTFINALFKNHGEKEVQARFEGKITRQERIIQLIKSEPVDVDINQDETFEFFFTPTQPGRYIVSGRILYDGKKTFEKSTVINVTQSGINIWTILKYSLYILLIIGIITLTYKIRQEKKIYRLKLRRLRR